MTTTSTEAEKMTVYNPYPAHQSLASETNCWNCYKLLWHRADTLKHLCWDCQQTCVAVEKEQDDNADS